MNEKRLESFKIKIVDLLKENEFTPKRRCDSVSDYAVVIYIIKSVKKTDRLILDFDGVKRLRLGVAHDLIEAMQMLRRAGIIKYHVIENAPYVLDFLELEKEKDVLIHEKRNKNEDD